MRYGSFILITAMLLILGVSSWFAYSGMALEGDPMPVQGYIALTVGIVFSLIFGIGLMALVFFSSRRGYDDQSADPRQNETHPPLPPVNGKRES